MQTFLTPNEKSVILRRAVAQTTKQSADSLGLLFHKANDCNKAIHKKVKKLTKLQKASGTLVLAVLVAMGEITREDLRGIFASLGIIL